VLQHVAVCCSVLQCVAVRVVVLQCVVLQRCSVCSELQCMLQSVALCCSALQGDASCCSVSCHTL